MDALLPWDPMVLDLDNSNNSNNNNNDNDNNNNNVEANNDNRSDNDERSFVMLSSSSSLNVIPTDTQVLILRGKSAGYMKAILTTAQASFPMLHTIHLDCTYVLEVASLLESYNNTSSTSSSSLQCLHLLNLDFNKCKRFYLQIPKLRFGFPKLVIHLPNENNNNSNNNEPAEDGYQLLRDLMVDYAFARCMWVQQVVLQLSFSTISSLPDVDDNTHNDDNNSNSNNNNNAVSRYRKQVEQDEWKINQTYCTRNTYIQKWLEETYIRKTTTTTTKGTVLLPKDSAHVLATISSQYSELQYDVNFKWLTTCWVQHSQQQQQAAAAAPPPPPSPPCTG